MRSRYLSVSSFLSILFVSALSDNQACPDEWVDTKTKCIYAPFDRFAPQAYAESEECRSNYSDSHLISIHSREDLQSITSILSNTSALARFFIGFQRSQVGEWAWLDGTDTKFVNWAEDEPIINNTANQQIYCAKMDNRGFWYSSNCRTARNFICAKPRGRDEHNHSGDFTDWQISGMIVGVYIPMAIACCLLLYAKSLGLFAKAPVAPNSSTANIAKISIFPLPAAQ